MKQSWISKGLLLMLPFIAIGLLWGHAGRPAKRASTQSETLAKSAAPPQQISPDGQASLRSVVQSGKLQDLRWPDFTDYGAHLQKFYESYGYSLPWVNGMEPTAQAQQLIAILLRADQKGLYAEDYDGPRWGDRLAKLKPATPQPSEADAVKFDVALTVCAMRYISDLHIGKVNPKHFAFDFDIEAKKYDLPQFLEGRCCRCFRCGRRPGASGASLSGVPAHHPGPPYLFGAGQGIRQSTPSRRNKNDRTWRPLSGRSSTDATAAAPGRPSGRRECSRGRDRISRTARGRA